MSAKKTASKAAPRTSSQDRKIDPELEHARAAIPTAFAILGLYTGGKQQLCPRCVLEAKQLGHPLPSPKTRFFADGGWKCHRCGAYGGPKLQKGGSPKKPAPLNFGNGVDVMVLFGYTFRDAKELLNGREASDGTKAPEKVTEIMAKDEFKAEVDTEVYNAIAEFCGEEGLRKAQEFYGRWHISPEAVAENKGRVADAAALFTYLKETFGLERLNACGLLSEPNPEKNQQYGNFLITSRYPVLEFHVDPSGDIRGIQCRATHEQAARRKALEAKKEPLKAAGDPRSKEIKIPPKFLSLRAAQPKSRIGFGIESLNKAPVGATVWIVEGYKDLLTARTRGKIAFGLPGVGNFPSAAVCQILARFNIVIAYDGDDGGDGGREMLRMHLATHGIVSPGDEIDELSGMEKARAVKRQQLGLTVKDFFPPSGKDLTDLHVEQAEAKSQAS